MSATRQREPGDDLPLAVLWAVSHDIRNPLATIKTSVTSLLDDEINLSRGDRKDLLAIIDTQVDRVDAMVSTLLDMGRLETGTLHMTMSTVALDDIVWAALDSVRDSDEMIAVDLGPTSPLATADPGLVERALANVIANALSHSDGAPVRVLAREHLNMVEVQIVDHGPGIPAEHRTRAFEPFQQLDAGRRGRGVGLGLAVARGFVEAMGGTVELEDTIGGGLTVVVRLRAADSISSSAHGALAA